MPANTPMSRNDALSEQRIREMCEDVAYVTMDQAGADALCALALKGLAASEKQPPEDGRLLRVRNAMAGRALCWERKEGIFSGGIIAEELRHWIDKLDEAMQ